VLRVLPSSFQPEQLAREYLALATDTVSKTPLLLLFLGSPPPVTVKGIGRLDLFDAIRRELDGFHHRVGSELDLDELERLIPDRVAWTKWDDISHVVTDQALRFSCSDPGVLGTIQRLSRSVTDAVTWHSRLPGAGALFGDAAAS
jgi:hypothetical protein